MLAASLTTIEQVALAARAKACEFDVFVPETSRDQWQADLWRNGKRETLKASSEAAIYELLRRRLR